jgi:uncharacterized protein
MRHAPYPRGMARTDAFDLAPLRLTAGEGRCFELSTRLDDLEFAGQRYEAVPAEIPVRLDVARMTGGGYSLRLRFSAALHGPCMRCLLDAEPQTSVDAREIDQPGGGEELTSPYVAGEELDLAGWARDAFALALPAQVVCREDCRGLCPVCGEDLNAAGDEHTHESAPDPRWAKLRELKLE